MNVLWRTLQSRFNYYSKTNRHFILICWQIGEENLQLLNQTHSNVIRTELQITIHWKDGTIFKENEMESNFVWQWMQAKQKWRKVQAKKVPLPEISPKHFCIENDLIEVVKNIKFRSTSSDFQTTLQENISYFTAKKNNDFRH